MPFRQTKTQNTSVRLLVRWEPNTCEVAITRAGTITFITLSDFKDCVRKAAHTYWGDIDALLTKAQQNPEIDFEVNEGASVRVPRPRYVHQYAVAM